jgi:hypothetical protein
LSLAVYYQTKAKANYIKLAGTNTLAYFAFASKAKTFLKKERKKVFVVVKDTMAK